MKASELQPNHFRFSILHHQQGKCLLALIKKNASTTRTEQFKGIFYSNTLTFYPFITKKHLLTGQNRQKCFHAANVPRNLVQIDTGSSIRGG